MFVSRMDSPEVRTALTPALIPMLMVGLQLAVGSSAIHLCSVTCFFFAPSCSLSLVVYLLATRAPPKKCWKP